jgi:hypothetical protein
VKINNKVLVIECIVLVAAVIFAINVQIKKQQRQKSPLGWAQFAGVKASERIMAFYSSSPPTVTGDVNQKFVRYVMQKRRFSDKPMPAPFVFEGDCAFFLILPQQLQSPSRKLIAYTEPRPDKQGNPGRVGLFLTSNRVDAVVITENQLRMMAGSNKLSRTTPDFYFCMNKN